MEANLGNLDKHLAAAGIPREPRTPAPDKTAPAAPAAEKPTVREAAEDFGAWLRDEAKSFRDRELRGVREAPPSMVEDSGTGTETGKAPAPEAPAPEPPLAEAPRGPSLAAPVVVVPKGLTKSAAVGFGAVTTDRASRGSSAGLVNTTGPRSGLGRDTGGNELKQSLEK
ncbi:MAG: hypothetical protein HOU01_08205 [Streptomycetaceae bacterium]|nr:hypothetical protein [Streptomycetaceae bacterium]